MTREFLAHCARRAAEEVSLAQVQVSTAATMWRSYERKHGGNPARPVLIDAVDDLARRRARYMRFNARLVVAREAA